MANAITIEVATSQIDNAKTCQLLSLAHEGRIAWCPTYGRLFVFQEQWQGIEEILNGI